MTKKSPDELPSEVINALWKSRKIEAIKILREEWNVELKESKDIIDNYVRNNPSLKEAMEKAQLSANRGCLILLLAVLLSGIAVYYFLMEQGITKKAQYLRPGHNPCASCFR